MAEIVYGKGRCPKVDAGSGYQCNGREGHGPLADQRGNDRDHVNAESGTGWAESECQPPVILEPDRLDRIASETDVQRARAAALPAAARWILDKHGFDALNGLYTLADEFTEYILTGERPSA